MESYDCFKLYLAIKNHFTSASYDYEKYGGKVNVKPETYAKRRDRWSFVKLTKTYADEDMLDLIVSNFLESDTTYVTQLLNPEAKDILLEYKRKHQALTYTFTNDVTKMFDLVKVPDDMLKVIKGSNPLLLKAVYAKDITLETFVILNDILGFFDMFSEKISDDFLWPKFRIKCEKYKSFLKYDINKFEKILTEKLRDQ